MPVPRQAIQEQLKALEFRHTRFNGSELRHLPQVVREGERVLALARGVHEGGKWLVVATDQRVLLLDKGVMYGVKQVELPIAEIQTVQHTTGAFKGELILTTASGVKTITKLKRRGAQVIADIVSRHIASRKAPLPARAAPAAAAAGPAGTPDDTIERLERLGKLRDSGVLSPEEFQAEKRRILGPKG
jgi:hypothetical protein